MLLLPVLAAAETGALVGVPVLLWFPPVVLVWLSAATDGVFGDVGVEGKDGLEVALVVAVEGRWVGEAVGLGCGAVVVDDDADEDGAEVLVVTFCVGNAVEG